MIIVGGGICGLMAATVLQRQGLRVTVLDKGRGLGGRLASRRLRQGDAVGCFDFGAQYFKATDPVFLPWVEDWMAAGAVKVWAEGMPTVTGERRHPGVKLYRGDPSNRSLAEYLARDLQVMTQVKVTDCHWQENEWQVNCESGQSYSGDRLILTPPLPQSLDLLANSGIPLPTDVRQSLEGIGYDACFSLSLLLEQPSLIPEPGGLWLDGDPLVWIADGSQKGVSPAGYGVTVQAGPLFSKTHLETNTNDVIRLMTAAAEPWLGSPVVASHLHLWRYSHPRNPDVRPFVYGEWPGPVYLGGDGFQGGKVEGAALSGLAIAADLWAKVNASGDR